MKGLPQKFVVAIITFVIGVAGVYLVSVMRGRNVAKRADASAEISAMKAPEVAAASSEPQTFDLCEDRRQQIASMIAQYGEHPAKRTIPDNGNIDGRVLCKPAPVYPQEAHDAGVEGVVVVKIIADDIGRVKSAGAISGPKLLRQAAEEAAHKAILAPTLLGGEPVNISGTITYKFTLTSSSEKD